MAIKIPVEFDLKGSPFASLFKNLGKQETFRDPSFGMRINLLERAQRGQGAGSSGVFGKMGSFFGNMPGIMGASFIDKLERRVQRSEESASYDRARMAKNLNKDIAREERRLARQEKRELKREIRSYGYGIRGVVGKGLGAVGKGIGGIAGGIGGLFGEKELSDAEKLREVVEKIRKRGAEKIGGKFGPTRKEIEKKFGVHADLESYEVKRYIRSYKNFMKAEAEEEREPSVFEKIMFGKDGAKSAFTTVQSLLQKGISSMGFQNLAAGVGALQTQGIVGAAATAVGGGLIDLLTSGYKLAAANASAMIGLAGLVGPQQAMPARSYSIRYGYNPREKAAMGMTFGRATGRLGREAMESMMMAERMGGLGGGFAGYMGALVRRRGEFGTLGESFGAMEKQGPRRMLSEAITAAIGSGLKRGRWLELFQGFAKMTQAIPIGYMASRANMMGMSMMLGRKGGAGFDFSASLQIMKSLDSFARGQGGPLADITSMMAAGLGEGGVGYFEALRRREGGIFAKGGGGIEQLRRQFIEAKQIMPHKGLRQHQLSQELGLSMKAVDRIETLFAGLKPNEKAPEAIAKQIEAIRNKEKPLRVRAYEGMAKFGGFKQVELRLERIKDTIGRIIAPTILNIFGTLLEIAENTLGTYLSTAVLAKPVLKGLVREAGVGGKGAMNWIVRQMLSFGVTSARILHAAGWGGPLKSMAEVAGVGKKFDMAEKARQREGIKTSLGTVKKLIEDTTGTKLVTPTGKKETTSKEGTTVHTTVNVNNQVNAKDNRVHKTRVTTKTDNVGKHPTTFSGSK